ncbi:MAG: L-rhamnose isomerase [Spirochaetes bacterium]|nr:L-rhamnose isomerase [Spirochaetota bacterium]
MDKKEVKNLLKNQRLETPSWGYADSGTRFYVFTQSSAARTLEEKLEDAAQVQKLTGVCPSVAIHIPWDKTDDWGRITRFAKDLGLSIGAANPNLFQEQEYMLGSVCNPDETIRKKAVDHMLECVEIMKITGSKDLSIWLADGTNYPGQDSFRARKRRMEDSFREVYEKLDQRMRMLFEYKFFEPYFYNTDLPDWGTAYLLSVAFGEKAAVLVDLGHHPLGTNIEQIVAYLLDEGKLGGFHFNNKKYADDDLVVGSVNPYELFLIYNELVSASLDADTRACADGVAYMIDQSHNIKNKIEATIQSVINIQEAYAKALLVDRNALASAQKEGRVLDAEECVKDAYNTDVRPLLREVREEMGLDPDPMSAFRRSAYSKKKAKEREKKKGTAKMSSGFQG